MVSPRPAPTRPAAADAWVSLESMAEEHDRGEAGLTEQQEAVVAHRESALLVLGAAGSGRTETLARRLGRFPVEQRLRATIALCFADPSRVPQQRFDTAIQLAGPQDHAGLGQMLLQQAQHARGVRDVADVGGLPRRA